MKEKDDGEKKEASFRGMCKMMSVDQSAITHDNFILFCDAISTWDNPPSDLEEQFVEVLNNFFTIFFSFFAKQSFSKEFV